MPATSASTSRQPDILVERRRKRAAGHKADFPAVDTDVDNATVARPTAPSISEPDRLPWNAGLFLRGQFVAADKVALVELDRPAETGLERCDVVVELVAIERHAGFEPQRVARAETDRRRARLLAGLASARPKCRRPGRCG